jgi:CheY-like chemotaxis protein
LNRLSDLVADTRRSNLANKNGDETNMKSVVILIADDDPEDCLLIKDAFKESLLLNGLRFVEDGEELMDYLRHQGKYKDPSSSPRPGIVLLDLNMPKKDGREALKEIKSDPNLKSIPVVVLTTSKAEEDILRSYNLGANSFITKPVTFAGLVAAIKTLGTYWLQIVELPRGEEAK